MWKHVVYAESVANERLASLAAEASAVLLPLSRVPKCHYFREDPNGRYARPYRASGFIDFRTSAVDLDVFVRGGLSPRETVRVVFHECFHVKQYTQKLMGKLSAAERESGADDFERFAPDGSCYAEVFSDLAKRLTKWHLHTGNLEAARKYHGEWQSVDPEGAAKLADSVLTPEERRLKIRLDADRLCRQVESELKQKQILKDFDDWKTQLRRNYGGSQW